MKKSHRITVRYSEDEFNKIQHLVSIAGISKSEVIRRASLGMELKDTSYQQLLQEIFRLHGDINRIGGLFKLYLSSGKKDDAPLIKQHLHKLELLSRELKTLLKEKL